MGKKKWAQTLIIYPALKKSEKRHKGENVTTQFKQGKFTAGRLPNLV